MSFALRVSQMRTLPSASALTILDPSEKYVAL